MTAQTNLRPMREVALDYRLHAETVAETPLRPWAELRASLDAEADTFNSQREARSRAYFIEKDRANG
jgi:hypothetical protein